MPGFVPLALPILFALTAPLQLGRPPVLANGSEVGDVVASDDSGARRWVSHWTMDEAVEDGRGIVAMTEVGAGRYSGFDSDVSWRTETSWSADAPFRPLTSEKTFTDTGGRPLLRQHTDFDHSAGEIRFRSDDLRTGRSTTETQALPADTLSIEGIAAALRTMAFEENASVEAHIFTPEPRLYRVTLEFRGREILHTPTGDVECYKIEVVPHVGILSLFRFLLPHAYFWFEVDAPHEWVRYQGPENGRGTPTITMERQD
jgi:Protein of unknown function (DUF3108)